MAYIPPKEWERLLNRVFAIYDIRMRELVPPPGVEMIAGASVFALPDGAPKLLFCSPAAPFPIYVADVDEDFGVANPVELPVRGRTPSIYRDEETGNWYLLVYSAVKDRRYGFYILSADLKTVVASQDPLLVDGVEWGTGGHGFLFTGRLDYGLFGFVDGAPGTALIKASAADLRAGTISFTKRPYPITVEAKPYATYAGEAGKGWAHDGASGPLAIGGGVVFLLSVHNVFGDRGLALCHASYDGAKDAWVAGVDYDMLIGPRTSFGMGWDTGAFDFGSPTNKLGRHLTLLVSEFVGGRSPPYKTYAMRLPWWLLSPKDRRLVYSLWQGNSIGAGETSPAMPGWGRKTIHFTSDAAGDLTVYLDAVGRNDWKEVLALTGITSALEQTLHSGLRMRLSFSVAATVTAHVMAEPT